MIKKIFVVITILILMALSFILGCCYADTVNNNISFDLKLPDESYIQELKANVSGEIFFISDDKISLKSEDKNFDISLNEKTEAFKISFNGPITEGVNLDFNTDKIDIKELIKGELINAFVDIDKEGKMTAITVSFVEGIEQ